MPGAVIAFDQARPGPSTSFGSPGVARKDLWQAHEVTARSTEAGNLSYSWAFLDIPPGSAATLADATTANARFTPDLPGSYRIQLTTNGGGPGNVQILIAAVTFDNAGVLTQRGWRVPAFGEAGTENNFLGQLRGWAETFEFILADIRTVLSTGGLTPPGANTQIPFNDGGVYGADPDFTFDKTLDALSLAAAASLRFGSANLPASGSLRFPPGARSIARWKDVTNNFDLVALALDAADRLHIGTDTAFTTSLMASAIRMRAASSVYFGVGANSYLELEAGLITFKQPEVVNAGTADGETRTRETSIQTTDALYHTLSAYQMPNDAMVIVDVLVAAVKNDGSLGVWWKKSMAHLVTGGSVSDGTPRDVDAESIGGAMPAWGVTFDVSGLFSRVRVNSQNDDVTWYILRQAARVIPIT